MPSSNIYSRAILGHNGRGGDLAALAMQQDQHAAQLEFQNRQQAWQQNYQQQMLDLQRAHQEFEQQLETNKVNRTTEQLQSAKQYMTELSKLDPHDVNMQQKLLASNATHPELLDKSANGISEGVQQAATHLLTVNNQHLQNVQQYAEKLGIDPLAKDKDGNYTFIDNNNGHFNLGGIQKTALDAQTAQQAKLQEQQAEVAAKAGLIPTKDNNGKMVYGDAGTVINKQVQDAYGIHTPVGLLMDQANGVTGNGVGTDFKSTQDQSSGFFGSKTPPAPTHVQFAYTDSKGKQQTEEVPIATLTAIQQKFGPTLQVAQQKTAPNPATVTPAPGQDPQANQLAQAQQWLAANPNHPMAASVQAKIASLQPANPVVPVAASGENTGE